MVVQLLGNVFDLLLGYYESTSRVWSLPLREAGLDPKLWPVSFI
jgi:hypothetical protein